jgi:hypothetical protein
MCSGMHAFRCMLKRKRPELACGEVRPPESSTCVLNIELALQDNGCSLGGSGESVTSHRFPAAERYDFQTALGGKSP